ncbi:MAG: hypothetical protein CML50_21555 [Rhodobacteraceae bacterium]|nr:hypothetical protein [Paracoccaceae bacterium]
MSPRESGSARRSAGGGGECRGSPRCERARACKALAVDRSSVRYRSVRPDDAEARTAMKAVAAERRRFGYRRIHVMLERQGIVMNLKKLRRLYREERLQMRAAEVVDIVDHGQVD